MSFGPKDIKINSNLIRLPANEVLFEEFIYCPIFAFNSKTWKI